MTREEAKRFWLIRYENAKDYTDPHWEAQERREHREYVEALRMAIESLQREDEFLKNFESNEPQVYDEGDPWNGRVPTHGRLIDADALYGYITNKVGGVDCAVLLDNEIAPTVQADRPHGEWIPVTERLPEIDEKVLGTDTYGNIRLVYLTNCGYLKPTFCTVEEGMSVDVVAWMALPEPYEEASNGKD